LSRTDTALEGTGGNLNNINQSLLTTVTVAGGLTNDLGLGMDTLLPHLDQFIAGVKEGPYVFGGNDGVGSATRVNIVAGAGTVGLPPSPPPGAPPVPGVNAPLNGNANPGLPASPQLPYIPGVSESELGNVIGFILATPPPQGGSNP
ncbi:MAG TPA: hypothetical protein VF134_05370, partial [Candidatus Dormibacteraeota bacterium]